MGWLFYAILSAIFAALTAILAKIGIKNVDSNLATAIRAVIILFSLGELFCFKALSNNFLQSLVFL